MSLVLQIGKNEHNKGTWEITEMTSSYLSSQSWNLGLNIEERYLEGSKLEIYTSEKVRSKYPSKQYQQANY